MTAASLPFSGMMEMLLALLLMVNRKNWKMDLTSTKLVGITSNTWMRTEEKTVIMMATDTKMNPEITAFQRII